MFWIYALLYLAIGFLIDWSMSVNTRPQLWSMLLWPFLLCLTACFYIRNLYIRWRDKRDMSDM